MQISHTHFLNHNSQKIRKQPLEGAATCCITKNEMNFETHTKICAVGFVVKKLQNALEEVQFLVKLQAAVPQLY